MMFYACFFVVAALSVNGLPNPQLPSYAAPLDSSASSISLSRLSPNSARTGRLNPGINFVQAAQNQVPVVTVRQPARQFSSVQQVQQSRSQQPFSPADEVSGAEFVLRNTEGAAQLRSDGEIVDPTASYTLRYFVQDPLSGDNKEVIQSGSAASQSGSYVVNFPDGSVRRTEWAADENGYSAVVTTNFADGTVEIQQFPGQAPEPVQPIHRQSTNRRN